MSAGSGQVGVDVGGVAIKFAHWLPGGRGIVVSGCIPRLNQGSELGADEVRRLAAVLARRGVECNRVVLGAPPAIATGAVLELPPRSSGAPIDNLARVELARIMRSDAGAIEAVSWDVPLGGKGAAGTTVMGVACLTEKAGAISELFEDAGLLVVAIEPECIAMARASERWGGTSSCVVVDLGATSGRVSVVVGGRVAMERNLGELGVLDRVKRAAGDLGVSVTTIGRLAGSGGTSVRLAGWRAGRDGMEELVSELAEDTVRAVHESVAYVHGRATGVPVDRVMIAGWGAEIGGVAERMSAALGIATEVIRPDTGGVGTTMSGVLALAAGLAVRGEEGGT